MNNQSSGQGLPSTAISALLQASDLGSESRTKFSKTWLFWEQCCNVFLAAFFFRFVYLNATDLADCFRLSSLLILVKVSADTVCHLIRQPAKVISTSPFDWAIGIFGAYTVFFFRSTAGVDSAIGETVQISGMILQVAAMFSLNRSIGFVAANRGVKTSGMYRFVRHPLYSAYCISFLGFVMNHPTKYNICIYCAMVLLLFLRILAEERILQRSQEYASYALTVRYRLIPGIL